MLFLLALAQGVAISPTIAPAVDEALAKPAKFVSRPVVGDASPLSTLHTQGWTVLPGKTLLPPKTLTDIRASTFGGIFNGQDAGEKPTRLQGRSSVWAPGLELLLAERLRPHGLLACSDPTVEKAVADCYALKSVACADSPEEAAVAGRQPVHSDAPEPRASDRVARLSELADADVPLSCILAVMPRTCFWVYPNGCTGGPELLRLDVGELLVWRGDLAHAGAGYAEEHYRVHAYLDAPFEVAGYERAKESTNKCAPTPTPQPL